MTQPDLHLSERMAAVLAGRARWSDAELDHLATCEACEQEFVLLGDVRRLGDGAPVIDAARMASLVVPRANGRAPRIAAAARRWLEPGRLGGCRCGGARHCAESPGADGGAGCAALVIAELDGLDQTTCRACWMRSTPVFRPRSRWMRGRSRVLKRRMWTWY